MDAQLLSLLDALRQIHKGVWNSQALGYSTVSFNFCIL